MRFVPYYNVNQYTDQSVKFLFDRAIVSILSLFGILKILRNLYFSCWDYFLGNVCSRIFYTNNSRNMTVIEFGPDTSFQESSPIILINYFALCKNVGPKHSPQRLMSPAVDDTC